MIVKEKPKRLLDDVKTVFEGYLWTGRIRKLNSPHDLLAWSTRFFDGKIDRRKHTRTAEEFQ